MSLTQSPGTWLAGACLVLTAACGGERSEPAPAAVQELAAPNAEGEVVTLRIPAGTKPQAVAPGQTCGTAPTTAGRQQVCEAGSYCAQATGTSAGTCVAAPGAPRNDG